LSFCLRLSPATSVSCRQLGFLPRARSGCVCPPDKRSALSPPPCRGAMMVAGLTN